MKSYKKAIILFCAILISIFTYPQLFETISEEIAKFQVRKAAKIVRTANIFVISSERLRDPKTKHETLDLLVETIYRGSNLTMPYRLYVFSGCEIHKLGAFTFFLDTKGELKVRLISHLLPFIEGIPKIPRNCSGDREIQSEIITKVSKEESSSELSRGFLYFFHKDVPLYTFHTLSLKN